MLKSKGSDSWYHLIDRAELGRIIKLFILTLQVISPATWLLKGRDQGTVQANAAHSKLPHVVWHRATSKGMA